MSIRCARCDELIGGEEDDPTVIDIHMFCAVCQKEHTEETTPKKVADLCPECHRPVHNKDESTLICVQCKREWEKKKNG